MQRKQTDKPKTGPYGRSKWNKELGKWTTYLTKKGRDFCASELAKFDNRPTRLFNKVAPELFKVSLNVMGKDLVESECMLAWAKAAIGYDPKRKVKFSTFAGWCMYNEVARAVHGRSMVEGKDDMPVNRHRFWNDMIRPDQMTMYETDPWDSFQVEYRGAVCDLDNREVIEKILAPLTDEERYVLIQTCQERRRASDIGEDLGISPWITSKILKQAKAKIVGVRNIDGEVIKVAA